MMGTPYVSFTFLSTLHGTSLPMVLLRRPFEATRPQAARRMRTDNACKIIETMGAGCRQAVSVSSATAHLSPSSRPGPRKDDTLVRLALSKLDLNTSRMPSESVTALIWRHITTWSHFQKIIRCAWKATITQRHVVVRT